jgi:hypothetical protein
MGAASNGWPAMGSGRRAERMAVSEPGVAAVSVAALVLVSGVNSCARPIAEGRARSG